MEPVRYARRRPDWVILLTGLRWLAVALSVQGGCSYSFDSGPQELLIRDRRIDVTPLPQLHDFSFLGFPGSTRLDIAADGRPWLWSIGAVQTRLVAIDAPEQVWAFSCNPCRFIPDSQGRLARLLVREPPPSGFRPGRVLRFRLGGGIPSEVHLPFEEDRVQLAHDTVVSWRGDKTPAALHLTRWLADDSLQSMSTPWPPAVDGLGDITVSVQGEQSLLVSYMPDLQPTILQFVSDGSTLDLAGGWLNKWVESQGYLVHSDKLGRLRVYFVAAKTDIAVDVVAGRPEYLPTVVATRQRGGFIVCEKSGLVAVDLDVGNGAVTGPPRILDRTPCAAAFLDPSRVTSDVIRYYTSGADLLAYQVPFDGSAAPVRLPTPPPPPVPAGGRVLSTCDREVAYTLSPPSTDVNPPSDGWVRGWRFTEQGWRVNLSQDCRRVRWFEHAESADLPSELLSARVDYGPITRLARSVAATVELPDGRLLVSAGVYAGSAGSHLWLLDEDLGEAQLLADSEVRFLTFAAVPRGDGSAAQWEREVLLESSDAEGQATLRLLKLPPR